MIQKISGYYIQIVLVYFRFFAFAELYFKIFDFLYNFVNYKGAPQFHRTQKR